MKVILRHWWRVSCVLLLLVVFSSGCGDSKRSGPPMGDVTGTVMYQEKPVVGASIVFMPSIRETPAGAALTDKDGHYRISISGSKKGAVTGSYKVSIALHAPYDGPLPNGMSLGSAQETMLGKSLIPEKYTNPNTSGLTAEVVTGSNTFNFALQD